jgi:UDP-N-acetylglucosamine/UDP-N-acetylgalactosamine diphosphorylase
MPLRLDVIRPMLVSRGQEHLLTFHDQIAPDRQASLLAQIESLDFTELDDLIRRYVLQRPVAALPGAIEPASYYPNDPTRPVRPYDADRFRRIGVDLIRAGKVAAFTVAGGQGTRLGWNGPKGTFPATVVTGKPLFRVFAEQIVAAQIKYGQAIPWYIMTSPANDAQTRAFFADNNHFGLRKRNIFLFPQGVVPTFDAATGRILLADKDTIAVNPDGHGGSIRALRDSGALDDMRHRGIEHISYFQIDNPLARAIDPLFVGLHAGAPDSSAQMSSKMVPKAAPEEKVGVFCRVDGRTTVIEYSDLPAALASQRDSTGRLRFLAGSIAIHLISAAFVEHHFSLPWHRADKKTPFIDCATGRLVEPDSPNSVKLETFVFDAIPLAESSIVYETSRAEEFAPIKNDKGVDSPATSHALQSDRAARWLAQHGVAVPWNSDGHVEARIEISPLTALDPEDLARVRLPMSIAPGQQISL